MCPGGSTYLPADCCVSELALWKSNEAYYSSAKARSSFS